jgi:hypothetical protein
METRGAGDEAWRRAQRVVDALAAHGLRGGIWIVYDALRITVESDAGVLGWLALHHDGTLSAAGMHERGPEVLALVQRALGDGGHGDRDGDGARAS